MSSHTHHLAPSIEATGMLVGLAVCIAAVCTLGRIPLRALGAPPRPERPRKMCVRSSIAPAVAKAGKAQGTTRDAEQDRPSSAPGRAGPYALADLGPRESTPVAVTLIFKSSGSGRGVLKNRISVCQGARSPGFPRRCSRGACASN